MRITIVAAGSRGDIQPYIALGRGLQEAGHGVVIVTNEDFEGLVHSYGLRCRTVPLDAQTALQDPKVRAAIEGGGLVSSFFQLTKLARRASEQMAERGLDAARGSDRVLAGFTGLFMAAAFAEKLGIPLVQAYNVPITPTGEFSGALMDLPPLLPAGLRNRLSHRATRQALWLMSRSAGNDARRRVLGLPSAPLFSPFDQGLFAEGPILYGISPAVLPRPADWHEAIEVTGYWFLDEPPDWAPPEDLAAFLERGSPPVYIGFGSMSHTDPEATLRLVLEALRLSGQRAVLMSGWGGLRKTDLPAGVLAIDSAPHAWLFPRVSAVVHHGGAGTTAAGLRAGAPSIVVPFHGDQPFWGRRVALLGVGPAPLPRTKLTAAALAKAIREAVENEDMRRRAAELGARIRAENGVARAVEVLGR